MAIHMGRAVEGGRETSLRIPKLGIVHATQSFTIDRSAIIWVQLSSTLDEMDMNHDLIDELVDRVSAGESRYGLLASNTTAGFPSSRDRFRFLGQAINRLGSANPFEPSALAFEPYNELSEAEANAVLKRLRPPGVSVDDLRNLGIVPVSVDTLRGYLPETANWDDQCFDHLDNQDHVLCDPYYCSALFNDGARWRQPPVALDWLEVRKAYLPPELVYDYYRNPTSILNEGAEMSATFLREIFSTEIFKNADEGLVPELRVHSKQEFEDICGAIRGLSRNGEKIRIWYRGQACEQLMSDGGAMVSQGYFLHREFRDVSLVPLPYRGIDAIYRDIDRFHRFVLEIMQWYDTAAGVLEGIQGDTVSPLGSPALSSLQGYGFPSQSIALTRSPEVAWWFATHRLSRPSQTDTYCGFDWAGGAADTWPCIYVFLLNPEIHPVIDVASLPSAPLRATRQEAGTLGNAGMLLRNGAARYVSLKIRLHPRMGTCQEFAKDYLFPKQSEDSLLSRLIPRVDWPSAIPLLR